MMSYARCCTWNTSILEVGEEVQVLTPIYEYKLWVGSGFSPLKRWAVTLFLDEEGGCSVGIEGFGKQLEWGAHVLSSWLARNDFT